MASTVLEKATHSLEMPVSTGEGRGNGVLGRVPDKLGQPFSVGALRLASAEIWDSPTDSWWHIFRIAPSGFLRC